MVLSADLSPLQWCILECLQGSRSLDWTESRQYDEMLPSSPLTDFVSFTVKVVRKYELNSQQVSVSDQFASFTQYKRCSACLE